MPVRVHLHGGLNEIGGNKFLVEDGEDRLYLDFGASLGARKRFFEEFLNPRTPTALPDLLRLGLLPWVDGLYRHDLLELARPVVDHELPESAETWRQRHGQPLVHGVLVTHAHVDHFQDLAYVDPRIPVYCTATTRTMLEAIDQIAGRGIDGEVVTLTHRSIGELSGGATFPGDMKIETETASRDLRVCPEQSWFQLGPFRAMAVPVDHSVPGAVAFLVETPSGKRVFYTGDIRFHGSLTDRTKALHQTALGLAPDLLLCEGTRIASQDQDDEVGVKAGVKELVEGTDGLAITEFAWKDTTRFDTVEQIARATGRTLVINPKLAYLLRRVDHLTDVPSRAPEHDDHVQVYLKRRGTMRYRPSDYTSHKHEAGYLADWDTKALRAAWKTDDQVTLRDPLAHLHHGVPATEIAEHPEDYILNIGFYEINELFDLDPPTGSRWIRCLTEPFSDEMEIGLERQCHWLDTFELEHNVPPTGGLEGLTHVSGHAGGVDLLPFIEGIEAGTVVPIHTAAEHVGVFEDAGLDPVTFEGMGFREAARGAAVVEL